MLSKELVSDPRPAPRTSLFWVIAGIVVVAFSLRAPIIAPTAVIANIQADTGLSSSGAGLLTGLPILLFALATPLATRAIRRFGPETTIILCLTGVMVGTVVRSLGSTSLLLGGTALIGAAMTLGNIAIPVLIRRDVHWNKIPTVTGAYSAIMNIGSMVTLLGTAPLAALMGWRWAIASWAVIAALGLGYWLARMRRERAVQAALPSPVAVSEKSPSPTIIVRGASSAKTGDLRLYRRVVALLIAAFCGQSAAYYATTAWLPLLLSESRGLPQTSSGATASLFQIAAVIGAFGVPLLAHRTKLWVATAVVAACWVSLPIGLLLAPDAFMVWSILGGIAQGGGFTAIFSIIPRVATSDSLMASASAKVQAGGYLAATFAPSFAGWLNSSTGSWNAPLLLILGLTLTFSVCASIAARITERH
ncbi:MFS transporter [Arthrobacter sp. MYb227]|nr:MFS transporter [Arthrobacter sp. MYb227]